jgi:hypothetical protein
VADYVDIPEELLDCQQDVTLCIDVMFLNKRPFFTTISRHILYRSATWLEDTSVTGYRSAIDDVLHVYKQAVFRVKRVFADNAL